MERFVTEKSKDYSLLDNHTGEILEYRQTRKVSVEEYIMIFLTSFNKLYTLRGAQLKVLISCWRYSTFNDRICNRGNLVYNNSIFKENCRKDGLPYSDATIDNNICQLAKKGFLLKQCHGTYLLNPKYFFKGTLSDRSRLQYTIMTEPEDNRREKKIKELSKELA